MKLQLKTYIVVWCTVPDSRFFTAYQHEGLIGNNSTCIKKGISGEGEFRPRPLKINTSVDDDIECQSYYQIRKGSIKDLKMRKLNDIEKNYLTGPFSTGTRSSCVQ